MNWFVFVVGLMWKEVVVLFVFGFERKKRVELFEVGVMFG